ncbi:MAG: YeeE/YedE thiosulfate transporter family protein, partial [Candidatus Competibacteraceae bacterium]|nr:YeeE/YedE thiosulfate transporter family protein [Candidatus Competibacteraceae bacterium]
LLLGARIAGGCTSGHGISGIAQLAVGSMLAVAAMFAGGILVAMLFKRV